MSDRKMREENCGDRILLDELPTDILLLIFMLCDKKALGRLSQLCRRFNEIIKNDCLWVTMGRSAIVTNQLSKEIQARSLRNLSFREKCRISSNWLRGCFKEHVYFPQKTRYMPWLVLSNQILWFSKGNIILGYERKRDGISSAVPVQRMVGHNDDVCRFVCDHDMIISGGRDGALCGFCIHTSALRFYLPGSHVSDISSVSVASNILISGSKDRYIKFWRMELSEQRCLPVKLIYVHDRIWCTSACPLGNVCAVGSSGCHVIPPLHLYDIEHGVEILSCTGTHLAGAGILDIQWESPQVLYSTGYDGLIRLWDTRTGRNIRRWEDPYDAPIYCLGIDHAFTILGGTCRHGRVQLWDKRLRHSLQQFFMASNHSTPVYSLAFDPCHLYAALDQSINVMDFSGKMNPPVTYTSIL